MKLYWSCCPGRKLNINTGTEIEFGKYPGSVSDWYETLGEVVAIALRNDEQIIKANDDDIHMFQISKSYKHIADKGIVGKFKGQTDIELDHTIPNGQIHVGKNHVIVLVDRLPPAPKNDPEKQTTVYCSAKPGVWVNLKTGVAIGVKGIKFDGTQAEWYETIIETIYSQLVKPHGDELPNLRLNKTGKLASALEQTCMWEYNCRKYNVVFDATMPGDKITMGNLTLKVLDL
jgi:hypothetical protein